MPIISSACGWAMIYGVAKARLNTMKQIYSGLVMLILTGVFAGCQDPQQLPAPQDGEPVFWMEAMLDGEAWQATAGQQGYFMETSYVEAEDEVYVFVGKLSPFECGDCRESLEIRIWDTVPDSVRDDIGFDEGLPEAVYQWFRQDGQAGPDIFRVSFQNESSAGGGNGYQWDFGDGNASSLASPTHDYSGNLEQVEVCLDSEDANGCITRICNDVELSEEPCSVDFSHSLSPGTSYVTFKAEVNGIPPFTYRWDFGDGYGATLGNPGYFYAQAGQYEVCLEVTDFFGCTRSICKKIAADPILCESAFSYEVQRVATTDPAPQYGHVQIRWWDAEGEEFRSDAYTQPADSRFQLLDNENYLPNAAELPTWRSQLDYQVRLFDVDSNFVEMKAGGWFGFAYPGN